MSSILTNNSAMVALQTLKSINMNLQKVQSEISTGLTVESAKDNAATWAISKVMSSDVAGFEAISDAHILRLRDAIHPEDAKTPVRRACFAMQLVLSGDKSPEDARLPLLRQLEDLSQVFTDVDSRQLLADATRGLVDGQHYRALKSLRALLPREERLLAARPN